MPSELLREEQRVQAAYGRLHERTDPARFSAGRLFNYQDLERRVLMLLDREGCLPLTSRRILDVGCGTGRWLRELVSWQASPENVHGVDLRPDAVATARRLSAPGTTIECTNAANLPYADGSFDLIVQSMAFTSILDSEVRRQVADEMLRVLNPDGIIVWYDFFIANPGNRDVRAIGGHEIQALFPGCSVRLRRCTLVPPVARWLASRSWFACHLLARTPLFCSHYLGTIRKNPLPKDLS